MQDYILKGIVLRAIDLKEKDKLVTIFTAERGVVSAIFRGVRQLKSKLKFATQPMCFAEFCLTGNGDILTCTGASEIESFFAVTQDYDKMVYAGAMLEMIYTTAFKEQNLNLFVVLVRALGGLCDDKTNAGVVFVKYCLDFFKCMGYEMNLHMCKTCGKNFDGNVALDLNVGAIICASHFNYDCINISYKGLKLLNLINNCEYDKLPEINTEQKQIKELVTTLVYNFNALFDKKLKSIKI